MDGAKHNALRCRWHKERQGRSVQNPDASWSKCFVHKSLIKLVNDLCFFMHRQCLLDLHRFFILLCVLLLSVWHYVKVLNLSDLHFPQFFNMVYHGVDLLYRFHLIIKLLMGLWRMYWVLAPLVFSLRTTCAGRPHKMCEASLRWLKEVKWVTIDIYLISSRLSRRI